MWRQIGRMAYRIVEPEFEIGEEPHEVTGRGEGISGIRTWSDLVAYVDELEQRAGVAEASLRRLERVSYETAHEFLLGFIEEVVDNVERCLKGVDTTEVSPDAAKWVRRMRILRKKIDTLLESYDIVPIDVATSSPGVTRVIGVERHENMPDGKVLSVIRRGYLWKGEVLRKASVVVSGNSDEMEV